MTVTEVARRLNFSARARHARRRARFSALPPLILVTDAKRLPDPLPAAAALPKGSAVILRHYEIERTARRALARRLKHLCRLRGLKLLIAGDSRLAGAVGADGLHLREAQLRGPIPCGLAERRRGWLVTAAAHSPAGVLLAARRGADAVLLSPDFPTASHPGRRALGPLRFAALARLSHLPVYGLGGIEGGNARRLIGSAAVGIAALGGLAARAAPAPRQTRRPGSAGRLRGCETPAASL
jgi:thiamine-phosphate pyrophosphorylase